MGIFKVDQSICIEPARGALSQFKPKIIFIIGGCRSGKSRHALELGQQLSEQDRIFIATCKPRDEEMQQRVAKHQSERDPSWKTMEVPVQIDKAIDDYSRKTTILLVDCLTLWISNLLLGDQGFKTIVPYIDLLTHSLRNARGSVILVSNEVGTGIVPEHELSRLFRDAVGFTNQQIAACSDEVIWMVAGIPVSIKQLPKSP